MKSPTQPNLAGQLGNMKLKLQHYSYLGFLLQCHVAPLPQAAEAAQLILQLRHLSPVSAGLGLLLPLQATARKARMS